MTPPNLTTDLDEDPKSATPKVGMLSRLDRAIEREGRVGQDEALAITEYARDLHARMVRMLTAYFAAESHKLRGRPRIHARDALDEADDVIEEWAVGEFGADWRTHEDVLLSSYEAPEPETAVESSPVAVEQR